MTAQDFSLFGGAMGCLIGIGLALAAVYFFNWWKQRQQKALPEPPPILDWRPTLRIDAIADAKTMSAPEDDIPGMWVLMVEERRLVSGIGGDPNVEIRWRYATRREVREVVSAYHRAMAEPITQRARSLRTGPVAIDRFDNDDLLAEPASGVMTETK